MYSPRIRDDLIPRIYAVAKAAGVPMTAWVNRALEKTLERVEGGKENDWDIIWEPVGVRDAAGTDADSSAAPHRHLEAHPPWGSHPGD